MSMNLEGKVALVTGASRGIGKGIALGLGEAGATVYVTGRTVQEGSASLPGSIATTAAEVTRLGGHGIAVHCDHREDAQVAAVFQQIQAEQKQLDVLVNNVYATPEAGLPDGSFWQLPVDLWDQLHTVGLRSHYVASVFAAPMMVARGSGLIVNISSGAAVRYLWNVPYGAGKAALDKMTADMAHDLQQSHVAVVSLWPPYTKTELVVSRPDLFDARKALSPLITGRAVAALAADPNILQRTGQVLRVMELAKEYGFAE